MSQEHHDTSHMETGYSKYVFSGHTGYIVAPWIAGVTHDWVAIRHSASVPPWADQDIHFHHQAEEYYFVFQGELHLYIADSLITLKPYEVLMVMPGVSHAVVGGKGPIEHFVIRTPAADDRQSVGETPPEQPPVTAETKRDLRTAWGGRAPLTASKYQNCWLFGVDQAHFQSEHLCLAYLNFPTKKHVKDKIANGRHRLHLHQKSWEYYTVLQGTKIVEIDGALVEINAGETLEVPPQTRHVLRAIHPPFAGFTFRVPRINDKIEF